MSGKENEVFELEIKRRVENLNYIYIKSYRKNKKTKVIIKDKKGYKYDAYFDNILKNKNIKFIHKNNPFSLENIAIWLKLNNSQFELLENNEYSGIFSKLNFYCKKCKDYPIMNWNHVFYGNKCGICDGRQVGLYHNLTHQFPHIAKEWHSTLNGDLVPSNVTYATNKKVWWVCDKGHEYKSWINGRTLGGHGCSICSDAQKESKIATELKNYILNKYKAKEEYSIFKNPETNRPLPYDIYIYGGKNPEINGVYIEIHWNQHYKITRWHKQHARKNGTTPEEEFKKQKHRDKIKRTFAKKNGFFIEVNLAKVKSPEEAILYVEKEIKNTLKSRSNKNKHG